VRPFRGGLELKCPKPKKDYPLHPLTVAEHLRKRRLDLKLDKAGAAAKLSVLPETYGRWESGGTTIPVRFYPGIIRFLGYIPLPKGRTRGENIRRARLIRGLKRLDVARLAGTVEGTVERLEKDALGITARSLRKVCGVLGVALD
jgi:hypothetical protein